MQSAEQPDNPSDVTKKNRKASHEAGLLERAKPFLKWAIIAVVIVFLGLTIRRAYNDVLEHREHLNFATMDWRWLVVGVFLYGVGLLPAGIAWLQTLKSFRQDVPFWLGLHTFFVGHLGKYVPGKAMVIVLRVGRLHPLGVEIKPTVVSVFVETLTSVCAGAILGSLFLLTQSPPLWMMVAVAIVIPCSIVFLLPHTFRAVLAILAKSRIGRMPRTVNDAFTWKLMLRTSAWMFLGWIIHGTAGWFLLCGIHPANELWTLHAWAACVAAISLGAVVGFASMLPSGAVVRELVITWLLSQIVPEPTALFVAIAFRIANLIAEFLMLGIVGFLMRRSNKKSASDSKTPE